MYQVYFYAPLTHVENIKNAMFASGAGQIGNYSHCAWQVLGEGQFMPLEGSQAFLGQQNQLEKVPEYKVEITCTAQCIQDVIAAMKKAHPYEEPAYQVFKLENF